MTFQKGNTFSGMRGRKHTPEAREKMRLAKLGKKRGNYSYKHRTKISMALMGNKNSLGHKHLDETKKKISKTLKKNNARYWLGKKMSEETKMKISLANSGENSPNWNPDREEVKRNLRNDGGYKEWMKAVKKRDNNTCWICDENCVGYNIVHHIKAWSKYPKLRYEITNGITLCQAHHPRTRAKEELFEKLFSYLVIQK